MNNTRGDQAIRWIEKLCVSPDRPVTDRRVMLSMAEPIISWLALDPHVGAALRKRASN